MNPKETEILIVDDTHNIKLLGRMLEQNGINTVSSTEDPTKIFNLHHDHKFHLIILDLIMTTLNWRGGYLGNEYILSNHRNDNLHQMPKIGLGSAQNRYPQRELV